MQRQKLDGGEHARCELSPRSRSRFPAAEMYGEADLIHWSGVLRRSGLLFVDKANRGEEFASVGDIEKRRQVLTGLGNSDEFKRAPASIVIEVLNRNRRRHELLEHGENPDHRRGSCEVESIERGDTLAQRLYRGVVRLVPVLRKQRFKLGAKLAGLLQSLLTLGPGHRTVP